MRTGYDYLFAAIDEVMKPQHIHVDEPLIGNKIHLVAERGMFVLERGPAVWLGLSCTHAGSGGVQVFDGVPDDDGFFPNPPALPDVFDDQGGQIDKWHVYRMSGKPAFDHQGTIVERAAADSLYKDHAHVMANRNGRMISHAHPAQMGMWVFSAGVNHGLTVLSLGEMIATPSFMSFTWMRRKER